MNTSVNSLMNKKYRFWGSSTCFRYLMQFLYTGAISGTSCPTYPCGDTKAFLL